MRYDDRVSTTGSSEVLPDRFDHFFATLAKEHSER